MTFSAAGQDEEFVRLIAGADAERDLTHWPAAEALYLSALDLYPLHHGYRVQLGHMLKEQGRYMAAEIQYRSALALGAVIADVLRHLVFVCERQGQEPGASARPVVLGQPMDLAPTTVEIQTLAYLFWRDMSVSDDDMASMLRRCASCEDAAVAMIADPRFKSRNATLIRLLKDRR